MAPTVPSPGSPPKRMTRARAAAKAASTAESGIKPATAKKATAASKRKAAPRIVPAEKDVDAMDLEPVKSNVGSVKEKKGATKGKAKADEKMEADAVEVEVEPKPARGTAKAKATTTSRAPNDVVAMEETQNKDMEAHEAEAPRPKSRARTTKKAVESEEAAPKTRGRPKRTVEATAGDNVEVKKPARARATAPTASTRSTAAATAKTRAAPKKKVTFQDLPADSDKENQPIPESKASRKRKAGAAPPQTGLKAKPVRKPSTSTARSRKSATTTKAASNAETIQPLSPKKATQVAKSNSSVSSDDDELSGEKTPMKPITKSPMKVATGSGKKLDFTTSIVQKSPTKGSSSTVMASPARRPPPSPFRDAMKESPKKSTSLGQSFSQPAFKAPTSPTKAPSLLQSSPKRGNLADPFTGMSGLKASGTRFKASLLQSPARRPVSPTKSKGQSVSPVKSSVMPSPTKMLDRQVLSPETTVTSHFRMSKSPERSVKVHRMTIEEQMEQKNDAMDFDQSVLDVRSPLKVAGESVLTTNSPAKEMEISPVALEDVDVLEDKMPLPSVDLQETANVPELNCPAPHEEIYTMEDIPDSVRSDRNQLSVFSAATELEISKFQLSAARLEPEGDESEDELQSDCTPLSRFAVAKRDFARPETPTPFAETTTRSRLSSIDPRIVNPMPSAQKVGFTPLAVQLSGWLASSPDKKQRPMQSMGIFSPAPVLAKPKVKTPRHSYAPSTRESLPNSTFFEDEMVVREFGEEAQELQQENDEEDGVVIYQERPEERMQEDVLNEAQQSLSQDSEVSEIYGDENEVPTEMTVQIPIDPMLLSQDQIQQHQESETQAQVQVPIYTPLKPSASFPREIHTVSKVPLRPAGEDSPIRIPRKRSRSLSAGTSSPRKNPAPAFGRSNTVISLSPEKKQKTPLAPAASSLEHEGESEMDVENHAPPTPGAGIWSTVGSPAKTPRRDIDPQVLQGAVVFVDVHTTEGAGASGIFVELLSQMGARCVRSWTWNPRTSMAGGESGEAAGGKIGITHVVYKDGGVRTLEKVRETKGVVLCVGVNWVLDCEGQNRWLDEADYAVDTSIIPRGGSRRRKSMEPRSLLNMNGNLVTPSQPQSGRRSVSAEVPNSVTKKDALMDESTFSVDSSPHNPRGSCDMQPTFDIGDGPGPALEEVFGQEAPETPSANQAPSPTSTDNSPETPAFLQDQTSAPSPTTPFYLSQGAKLVQQTCPPKQTQQGLFPVSGRIDEVNDETLRARLEMARRRSLRWRPRVGSPLGR